MLKIVSFSAFSLFFSIIAMAYDAVIIKPANFDPLTYKKHITFFQRGIVPPSTIDIPKVEAPLTEAQGRDWYFNGILPMVKEANIPNPDASEFESAIDKGRVVNPPCATSNSQVLAWSARKAGLDGVAEIFDNPHDYYPTHNNEFQIQALGWNYFLMSEYVAPRGAVGAWDRYTFDKIPGHTGHIFIVFKDTPFLVGDNTRRKDDLHGHPYRMPGSPVGFWLPPGVYPTKR
jgi:hypothetical protein